MVVTASCGEKSDDGGSDGWYDDEEWGQSACNEWADLACGCEDLTDTHCHTIRAYAEDNAGKPEAEEYCEEEIERMLAAVDCDGDAQDDGWGPKACDELADLICECDNDAIAVECETFRAYAEHNASDPTAQESCEEQMGAVLEACP